MRTLVIAVLLCVFFVVLLFCCFLLSLKKLKVRAIFSSKNEETESSLSRVSLEIQIGFGANQKTRQRAPARRRPFVIASPKTARPDLQRRQTLQHTKILKE
jgi:hypothetical protein